MSKRNRVKLSIPITLMFILVWMGCGDKIEPGKMDAPPEKFAPQQSVSATIENITEWYEAVGTIRPKTESSIESQVSGQVMEIKVRPGTKVKKDQTLISLDNRQLLSRVDQAKQGLKAAISNKEQARQEMIAAKAAFAQAESDYKRVQTYFNSQAATERDLEQAKSAYLQAKAAVTRAEEAMTGAEAGIRQSEQVIAEANIGLGYTTIKAPEDGEVLQRLVEPGDIAVPGKPLLILQTAGGLRFEAFVREGLISKTTPGAILQVKIDTIQQTVDATVDEIIPYADPNTRTFLVKVSVPRLEGMYPGMYGKLLIPVEETQVVMIPQSAVMRVGQLDLVWVKENATWKNRFIKTGKRLGDKIEVLTGLSGNETLGIKGS